MIRKATAYLCLLITVPFFMALVYWFGVWVLGDSTAMSEVFTASVILIILGALFNHLHPDRTNG